MFVQFFAAFVMMVVSSVIQLIMTPETTTEDPEAGSLDVPTAEEGREIPVLFGTDVIKNSNVVWYGDSSTKPIYSSGGGKK